MATSNNYYVVKGEYFFFNDRDPSSIVAAFERAKLRETATHHVWVYRAIALMPHVCKRVIAVAFDHSAAAAEPS